MASNPPNPPNPPSGFNPNPPPLPSVSREALREEQRLRYARLATMLYEIQPNVIRYSYTYSRSRHLQAVNPVRQRFASKEAIYRQLTHAHILPPLGRPIRGGDYQKLKRFCYEYLGMGTSPQNSIRVSMTGYEGWLEPHTDPNGSPKILYEAESSGEIADLAQPV